jgi:hypothetical protein
MTGKTDDATSKELADQIHNLCRGYTIDVIGNALISVLLSTLRFVPKGRRAKYVKDLKRGFVAEIDKYCAILD